MDWRLHRYSMTLPYLPKSGSVIDVGCNSGDMAKRMLDRGLAVMGVDHRKFWTGNASFPYVQGDAMDLPFEDNHSDYVTCFEVLEHLPFPAKAVCEFQRVAKKKVFLTVPVNKKCLDPGHVNFFKTSCCLKALMPGCKVRILPRSEGRWYFAEWNVSGS